MLALNAGIPKETPAFNVNRLCGFLVCRPSCRRAQTILLNEADINRIMAVALNLDESRTVPLAVAWHDGARDGLAMGRCWDFIHERFILHDAI